MFWKKDPAADALRKAASDLASIRTNTSGATRRVTGMVPVAAAGTTREVAHTSSVRFHQLLISLEGNQRTGCLRIISPRNRSRSAILIHQGRVVGCLYGSRKQRQQYLQEDAHKKALADLAAPGNILDAYELPEDLVLAAASLFNGQVIPIDNSYDPASVFNSAMQAISSTQSPGCIVVSTTTDEMVCMVYMSNGKILGVFSAHSGWIAPTFESVQVQIKGFSTLKISASFLPESEREQPSKLGFSLTGLADNSNRKLTKEQIQAVESFATIRMEPSTYSQQETVYGPQQRTFPAPAPTDTPVRSADVFSITPY